MKPSPDYIADHLTVLFGPQCGLNADWCFRAWHVMGQHPNLGLGVYLLDQEDGTWDLVWHRADVPHENWIVPLQSYTDSHLALLMDLDDLKLHLREIARAAIVTEFTPLTP